MRYVAGTNRLVIVGDWPTAQLPDVESLDAQIKWTQRRMCGSDVPRQEAFFDLSADKELSGYRFGGGELVPDPCPPTSIVETMCTAQTMASEDFNAVVVNRYMGANSSVAWHSDDEASEDFNAVVVNRYMGANSSVAWHSDDEASCARNDAGQVRAIASLSLGQTRTFQLRPKSAESTDGTRRKRKRADIVSIELRHGQLLIMLPGCQEQFEHRLVKASKTECGGKEIGLRINLTYRVMMQSHSRARV